MPSLNLRTIAKHWFGQLCKEGGPLNSQHLDFVGTLPAPPTNALALADDGHGMRFQRDLYPCSLAHRRLRPLPVSVVCDKLRPTSRLVFAPPIVREQLAPLWVQESSRGSSIVLKFSHAVAMTQQSKHLYMFGPYRIDPTKRVLLRGEEAVQLPSKVFEILLVLVEHSEEVVSKDDLLKTVWPDSFVEESNLSQSIFLLRKALGETAQDHRYIVTIPGRGYRFAEKVEEISEETADLVVERHSRAQVTVQETESAPYESGAWVLRRFRRWRWNWTLPIGVGVTLLVAGVALFLHTRQAIALGDADMVLVSDFVNTTGEPVFDGSLKQALTVKLAESPYFNVVSDSTTRQTLSLMARSPDERVVPPVAREACQRAGAKVVVGGSIVRLGSQYALDLDAVNCLTGGNVAHVEVVALNREQVLKKLGELIPPVRRKLGESVSSLQKFDTPIEQATTRSLSALKAYTLGDEKRAEGKETQSVPSYNMAIELDPDFAMAYARLATIYGNLDERDVAADYIRKAFERREHVSEKEKFYIQARYYADATRETEKAIETWKLWSEAYPSDFNPLNSLSSAYVEIGQPEKAIEAGQQALRVNANHALPYASLGRAYERATRFAEAKAICEKAIAEKVESSWTHQQLYRIAFVEGDEPALRLEIDWFKGKPQESVNLYYQAKAALSLGQLRRSRELFERARAIAIQHGLKEQAVSIINGQAQFDADTGIDKDARAMANLSLRMLPNSPRHNAFAALALARIGDSEGAEAQLNGLSKLQWLGTDVYNVVFPSIRAAIQLDRKNPAAAVEELRPAIPYDLGTASSGLTLYYRGLAYLELKSGNEAAAQFQKILDNRGVVTTDSYWPLAHLGLARAYAQAGDTGKSLAEYREFLTLWKNADSDLRILKQAKHEYAKLGGRT
jgi:DNA-binding winged helix-turn-helix (wHTH) protein/tetratricopeptide (TPR) repeat protein